ncbi:tail fiber assembly protein [Neisseria sp. Ec49-e6-T10]|uniref:tail fiber assembly protein n=1 Tax=Neisseria sp. Ec49-e6-T10 TaxID=3140744 RepID=UPI003EBC61B3
MIFYNAKTKGFYDENPPIDSVEISIKKWNDLLKKQANGFQIVADENGFPVAVEPKQSKDEILQQNKLKQKELIDDATLKINMLQDEIDLNMQEDAKKTEVLLKQWKMYRVTLNNISFSFDEINWPEKP